MTATPLRTSGALPLVSPAGSGPAPRWGASRTDRSGSGDQGVGRLAPQANKIPPLRGAPGRVPALGNKIPPQAPGFSVAPTDRLGKPSPKTPVSERSERIGVFPGPSGHGPGRRDQGVGTTKPTQPQVRTDISHYSCENFSYCLTLSRSRFIMKAKVSIKFSLWKIKTGETALL